MTSGHDDALTARVPLAPTPVRALRCSLVASPDRFAEGDVISIGTAEGNDLRPTDPTVSRFHLEIVRTASGIAVRDLGSTNGTRIGAATFRAGEVLTQPGTVLELGATAIRVDDAARYVARGVGPPGLGGIVGHSEAIRTLTSAILKVAQTDVSVVITGESGTGKELAARAIHDASARAEQPFVTVDCAALSPSLFASELFGHEKGAFTGADRRHVGAFERASGGTLFLDELAELGPELQASLLGVLQRGRLRRVGGSVEVPVDVRIVAATHRDLRSMVNDGSFRLDLFFRLATVRLTVPSLRERASDIPLLIDAIAREVGREEAVAACFPPETVAELARHAWPGNVRELRNVVLGTLALGEPPRLEPIVGAGEDVVERVLEEEYGVAKRAVLDDFERRWLVALLRRAEGNVRAASRLGNVERKHLMELLRRHRLTSG